MADETTDQGLSDAFWQRPDIVERFAERDPDVRLLNMLERWEGNRPPSVLDLGCAGGRNTVALAKAGASVHAFDRSPAMLAHTLSRLSAVIGPVEARARTHLGSIHDLTCFRTGMFDWVVALGIFAAAGTKRRWTQAVMETARVTAIGGQVLVASFSPESQPEGRPMERVPGEPDGYRWKNGRRSLLLDPESLDRELSGFGLIPAVPTVTVKVPMGDGFRVTINALYLRT